MEITSFNGFSCESSNEDDIDINYNNKERQTWTKTLNTAVMECYFLSRPVNEEGKPVRGYRRRMHNNWKKQYGREITEQCLCDQAKMIRKNKWITKLELESISRKVLQKEKDIEINNNDNTGEQFYQDEGNVHENEATQAGTENLGEEKTMIQDILDLMKDHSRIELRGFNKIDTCVLVEWSRKINCILNHIKTENITDTNILIKATIVYVGKKIGLKTCGSKNKKESEPWWKRKIKKLINKVKKHINILERHQRGEIRRKEKHMELERKYNITKKGIRTVIEELKQRVHAKTAKLKRYGQRVNQYKINKMFVQNQKKSLSTEGWYKEYQ